MRHRRGTHSAAALQMRRELVREVRDFRTFPDISAPLVALIGSVILAAATCVLVSRAADLIPASSSDPIPFADRADLGDVTFPFLTTDEIGPVPPAPTPAVTPKIPAWAHPCRGCGPERHPVLDDSDEALGSWYGEPSEYGAPWRLTWAPWVLR